MSAPLELTITIGPAPKDAGPTVIGTIAIACPELGLSHAGDLLTDPITADERKELDWYLEESWKWPFEGFATRAAAVERKLPEIGHRLFKSAFGSTEAHAVFLQWHHALLTPGQRRQIGLRSTLPLPLRLPWELLHDELGFLALRVQNPVSILRRLPQTQLRQLPGALPLPLRVLLVVARPTDAGFVDPRTIARALFDGLDPLVTSGTVEVEILRPPTLPALLARLSDTERPVHVLHFDGHGDFDAKDREDEAAAMAGGLGVLAFENDDGTKDLVPAKTLANLLQDSGVRFAVLNACRSARGDDEDVFASVAASLVRSGVNAVVAMSAKVLVVAAVRYVARLYAAIAKGEPIPTAHERGRQQLYAKPDRHVLRRRRDERGAPVKLVDWWLPHLYEQRPFTFTPSGPAIAPTPPSPPRFSGPLDEPRYGFTGRGRELLALERALLRGKLVLLHGFGGAGKTALASEAARWLCRTGMYRGACLVSFEHGGDARGLFSALGTHLGVNDGAFRPEDPSIALPRLQEALKKERTLLVADNLESVLPGGEAALPPEELSALWEALTGLAATPEGACGVVLTSRDANLGDGRMRPGKGVKHQPVEAMHPEEAYALATQVLEDLEVPLTRAPYPELRDLLKQLDHHPLAIQLVLQVLEQDKGLTLGSIAEDFAKLLPRFKDDTVTGRNRSLEASLEYSLQRLGEEERELLLRLAPFEGGAEEKNLLAITGIPYEAWSKLRSALEKAALVRVEQVHQGIDALFLRFHPTMAPYLMGKTEESGTRERYTRYYLDFALYLYLEDDWHPAKARELAKRELPNLRRTFKILLSESNHYEDESALMMESLGRFLNIFGYRGALGNMHKQARNAATENPNGQLTYAFFLRTMATGEGAFRRGDIRASLDNFTALLKQIEERLASEPLGPGSYEHCVTLGKLGRCLAVIGQHAFAQKRYQEALTHLDSLLAHRNQEEANYIRLRSVLLTDLSVTVCAQGDFLGARTLLETAFAIYRNTNDQSGQVAALDHLARLAFEEGDYAEAERLYIGLIPLFKSLADPAGEATIWYQLGILFRIKGYWPEAEGYLRESLLLRERMYDEGGSANTCNALGNVTKDAGRIAEAETWYRRALSLLEKLQQRSAQATTLSNLAALLAGEARAGRDRERLLEARQMAEQSLVSKRSLDASVDIWVTLSILADIAEQQQDEEVTRCYRREERETYAAFPGNRSNLDKVFGELFPQLATAVLLEALRPDIEPILVQLESTGWKVADRIRRIWAGERDWHALSEGIDRGSALFILRVLETLQALETPPTPP